MADRPRIPEDQQVDLSAVTNSVKNSIGSARRRAGNIYSTFSKFRILFFGLFVAGIIAGALIDHFDKTYRHEIILIPNFGSVDYLYSKVELLNAKISENDTVFLKRIGITEPKKLHHLKIEPVNNVYQFVGENEIHFELLKLIAEDENMKDVMEDRVTSKNYSFHILSFSTEGRSSYKKTITPLLNYFNDSEYYNKIKLQVQSNEKERIAANNLMMKQIDDILAAFNQNGNNGAKSNQLVYYNENTQLNELIKTREWLVQEQGKRYLNTINYTTVIKDSSITLNMRSKAGLSGKMKFALPFFLVFLGLIGLWLFRRK